MFDRRVKIFLGILVLITLVLLARVMQIQVLGQAYWDVEAGELMRMGELVETVRGRLLDRNRNPMAIDAPCMDAAVDYRAILFEPEPKWVAGVARTRVRARMGSAYSNLLRSEQLEKIEQEKQAVRADIRIMWDTLTQLGGMTQDQMDDLRRSIIRKVNLRRRKVWYAKYQRAVETKEATTQPSAWYERWLNDESQDMPEVDEYFEPIFEERQPHVILPDVTNATNNFLGKNSDRFPGLDLRASVHRTYPYADVAAHVIGNLGRVERKDINKNDSKNRNELRDYELNDLVGRSGLESLCEALLRGTRGKIERYLADSPREVRVSEPVPGRDVFVTLDMELQRDIHRIFSNVELTYKGEAGQPTETERLEMPGAAVVIDVKSSDVLALVSYPSYNLNELDENYSALARDVINRPLMNRATWFALEPGSTVKPIVGIGAITQGAFGWHDTIECTGYLQLGGRTFFTQGRCWVASYYETILGREGVRHHPVPYAHPNGFLTFPDALERSCNVFFETIADRLGLDGLGYWYDQFGLGRPTGIGISESSGRIPRNDLKPSVRRPAAWFSGIGQGEVLATPVQMANVAATIARKGIWMRPRLLLDERDNPQTPADRGPEFVDLKLSPEALAQARLGMVHAVNEKSGTGTSMHRDDMIVAGKTGSAQAAALTIPKYDETGKFVEWKALPMGTHEKPTPEAPWYRGWGTKEDRRSHAWVIGFAPAEDPKIAFAVMVEYGGGGGATAGWVAKQMLDACVARGYLLKK